MDDADRATDLAERERAALAVRPPAPKEPRAGAATCIDCGEPIEPGRLAVLPHAVKCAFCAGARPQ